MRALRPVVPKVEGWAGGSQDHGAGGELGEHTRSPPEPVWVPSVQDTGVLLALTSHQLRPDMQVCP